MHRSKSFLSALFAFFTVSIFTFQALASPIVGEKLLKQLKMKSQGPYRVIVGLNEPDDYRIQDEPDYTDNVAYRDYKSNILHDTHNKAVQLTLPFDGKYKKYKSKVEVESLWLANAIVVKGSRDFIEDLSKNDMVKSLHFPRDIKLEEPKIENPYSEYDGYTYGLAKMRIPELETDENMPEIRGDGIIVGEIDTGVNANHPDLVGKVIAFKDFINGKEEPYDDNDHGTHVAGTIAGGNASGIRIGVAPKAKLMVAKVFDENGWSSEDTIIKAMQWLADPDGDPATNDGPVVINNSWGSAVGTMEEERPFWKAVENWVELGIFPCFAAGNSGPDAETVGSPGGFPHSFAVAASTQDDTIAYFSSRGPFFFDGIPYRKPDVSAPGFKILSAASNGGYLVLSGTSMATPHVTGLIALISEVRPDLSVNELGELLRHSSIDIDEEGYDYNAGWGRVDAYAAISQIVSVQYQLPLAYK